MTTGTAPLIDRQRDKVKAEKNAETIAGLGQDMLDHFARMVAEQITEIRALREMVRVEIKAQDRLQAENAALRAVAVAADKVLKAAHYDQMRGWRTDGEPLDDIAIALSAAIDAGYLPGTEETRP